MKPASFVIFSLAVSYIFFVGYDILHSTGQVGATKLNGDGCTCHGGVPIDSVIVWISGPDTVALGGVAMYTVYVKGGPAVAGGYNAAAQFGTLAAFDTTSRVIAGELTHRTPKSFVNDTVEWKLIYHAPLSGQTDTLYSVGNSVNRDGTPLNDQYNFGANVTVHLKDTTSGVEDEYAPVAFTLSQNYPNPFNPVTKITYRLVTSGDVRLTVYNLRGEKVATLVDARRQPGEHTVQWDGGLQSSGLYFYTLNAAGMEATKKMLLIR